LLAPPTSHASLSLEELQKLFETQDAAWRKAAPGSKERGDEAEAAAQSAADIAWKYFDAGDARTSGNWFARRAERKKEAYEARRTFVNARLERQDKGRAQAIQEVEASWDALQRSFHRCATPLAAVEAGRPPSRPIEHASSMAVQKIVMALQQEERAAWQKATEGKTPQRPRRA
jgi:hypothetical protein